MRAPETDPLDLCGRTLAHKYLVQELVDVGGFSIVYRAHHTVWKKPVAVKLFNALSLSKSEQRDALQEAFVREGALLAELSSRTTSIVQAWDVGTYTAPNGEWMPFMVLEWLEGKPLDLVIDEEIAEQRPRWTFDEVHSFLADVAGGLELAHHLGVAHRDVKPGNLFVVGDARSGNSVVKILDFGIAKVMAERTLHAALATTGVGIRSFTPEYGAPEQFSREYGATGPWTDVFGLALLTVELLSRKRPLGEGGVVELARASTDPARRPTPRALGVPTPAAIEAVFERALAVSPSARYATAGELWRALGDALSDRSTMLVTAPSIDAVEVSSSVRALAASVPPRRRTRTALGAVGALAAIGAGALFAAKAPIVPLALAAQKQPATLASVGRGAALVVVGIAREMCPRDMLEIPAGQFYMGSHDPGALPNEKPSFNVRLGAFCIDRTEVTVAAYRACSTRGACLRAGRSVSWPKITEHERAVYGAECNDARDDRLDHPINCVSWAMAKRYCELRAARLPTEAEWEFATRGPDGRVYPWGDEEPTPRHLNACGPECVDWGKKRSEPLAALYSASDGFATTAPVARFEAGRSRFGPYDVVGNVWEWVDDWYAAYTPDEKIDPRGPKSGDRRVIRGGGWNGSYASWLRPSFRYAQDPEALSAGIGFRCALDLPRAAPR